MHGTPILDDVRYAYRTAVQLHPSPELLFTVALTSMGLREKDYAVYLEKVVVSNPKDNLLIKVGRLAKTLNLEGIVKKVQGEFAARELAVHLYPL